MNLQRQSLRAFGLLLGSYALLTFIYVLPFDGIVMQQRTMTVFFFFPAVLLYLYFIKRITDDRVRKYLVLVAAMILFWCVLCAAKYIAFEENEKIARFIWYMYYIAMLSIPQFSFLAALSVARPPEKKLPFVRKITGMITLLCILVILTNDLHQRVFLFHPGFANWDSDYTRRPLFWVITIWVYLFFLFSSAVLFQKCRLTLSRKLVWIPMMYLCLGILGLYLLNTGNLLRVWGKTIGEFPEMACYTLGGFWLLCITIGLVPSNNGYGKLLKETSLAVRIADLDYKVVYQSRSANPLSVEQLSMPEITLIDENTFVYRKTVTGGYAYWQVDIAEMNRINRELEEAKEKIAEEAEFIRQANEWKKKQALIDEKSKVYDAIALRVLPQSQKIALLSEEAQHRVGGFEKNMRLVSIYAVYIKRIANMMLIASENKYIKQAEVQLAILESVRYLNKAGIIAEVSGEEMNELLDAEQAIRLYERFEVLLEQALPTLKALHVIIQQDVIKLNFEGAVLKVSDSWKGSLETDDDITYVRLNIREEGEMV